MALTLPDEVDFDDELFDSIIAGTSDLGQMGDDDNDALYDTDGTVRLAMVRQASATQAAAAAAAAAATWAPDVDLEAARLRHRLAEEALENALEASYEGASVEELRRAQARARERREEEDDMSQIFEAWPMEEGGEGGEDTILGESQPETTLTTPLATPAGVGSATGPSSKAVLEPGMLPIEVHIPRSTLVTPIFMHCPFEPPAQRATEARAVAALLEHVVPGGADGDGDGDNGAAPGGEDDYFLELELRDFVVYGAERTFQKRNHITPADIEMRNLALFGVASASGPKAQPWFAAGVLAVPGRSGPGFEFWVESLTVAALPMGNYGRQYAGVGDQIWITTALQEAAGEEGDGQVVYYKLAGPPAMEYARFWEPFVWAANLAKHFVDFVEWVLEGGSEEAEAEEEEERKKMEGTRKTKAFEEETAHAEDNADETTLTAKRPTAAVDAAKKISSAKPKARRKSAARTSRDVSIYHFRHRFARFLERHHKGDPAFDAWYAAYGKADFRNAVVVNCPFLWKEAGGVLGARAAPLTIWREISTFDAIPRYPSPGFLGPVPKTVVTRYTYECFRGLPFGAILDPVEFGAETAALRNEHIAKQARRRPAGPLVVTRAAAGAGAAAAAAALLAVCPGDVISIEADASDAAGSCWRANAAHEWYLLVQAVYDAPRGSRRGRRLDATWLYRPADTAIGDSARYPWPDEVFLSDHCTCAEDKAQFGWIYEEDVTGVHAVAFGGSQEDVDAGRAELFCRQVYLAAEDNRWVTFKRGDLACRHRGKARDEEEEGVPPGQRRHSPGATVLADLAPPSEGKPPPPPPVASKKQRLLEPCVVVGYVQDHEGERVRLRRLLRRARFDRQATGKTPTADAPPTHPPNELVWTDRFVEVRRDAVQGTCHVRVFAEGQAVPLPYNRNGTGLLFYMTYREAVGGGLEGGVAGLVLGPLEPIAADAPPLDFCPGFDPSAPTRRPKLRGLDLFCGGGNFGRGLEEGGAVRMKWCNDYSALAMHTYMANLEAPGAVRPFLGSIDDLQRLAIRGHHYSSSDRKGAPAGAGAAAAIPRPGQVDFVSGGSPCPGFSNLTQDKTTPRQRKNQSLIASFVSAVDLYRPKFGLLENVIGLVESHIKAMARHAAAAAKAAGEEGEDYDDDDDGDGGGGPPKPHEEDVCGQLLAALIGLGYQAQMFSMTAARYGGCQKRQRVFLVFAAPGLRLPARPAPSHPHQPGWSPQSKGLLPNGQRFLAADVRTPALPLWTAGAATADLPPVYEGHAHACVAFPDHRLTSLQSQLMRCKTRAIPIWPRGVNFADSFYTPEGAAGHIAPMTTREGVWFLSRLAGGGKGPCTVSREEVMRLRRGGAARQRSIIDDGDAKGEGAEVEEVEEEEDDDNDDKGDNGGGKRRTPAPAPATTHRAAATTMRFGRLSNAFGRISAVSAFETVTTAAQASDGKAGRWLHWHEPRQATAMEARRAQGFRDDDVLLGSPLERWRIVGNSVSRDVSLALGLAFREAWAAGEEEEEDWSDEEVRGVTGQGGEVTASEAVEAPEDVKASEEADSRPLPSLDTEKKTTAEYANTDEDIFAGMVYDQDDHDDWGDYRPSRAARAARRARVAAAAAGAGAGRQTSSDPLLLLSETGGEDSGMSGTEDSTPPRSSWRTTTRDSELPPLPPPTTATGFSTPDVDALRMSDHDDYERDMGGPWAGPAAGVKRKFDGADDNDEEESVKRGRV